MNSPILQSSSLSSFSLWLNVARVFQVAIICLTLGLFIAGIPINYEQRHIVCRTESCPPWQLTAASEQALNRTGMSVDFFVSADMAVEMLAAATYIICAIVMIVRKPNDMLSIFVSIMLVTFGAGTFTGGIRDVAFSYPGLDWLFNTIGWIGNCAILAFFFVFPNGRFIPPWTVFILAGHALVQLPHYYFPDSPLNLQISNLFLYILLFLAANLSGLASQIYRYRRVSNSTEKQQTKWVVYGLSIGIGGYMTLRTFAFMIADPDGTGFMITMALRTIAFLLMLLLPISISIAILRYRLWNINPIINRTLVYGALSFLTIALYVLTVGGFALYFRSNETNIVISFIATGVVAILFEPLRQRLQRAVNRLMYGDRDDPATVLMRLSARLDSTLAPDSVLQTIVETLAQTLRLPYAAISLSDSEPRFTSTFDLPPPDLVSLPLTYQTERVGRLLLAPRAPGEFFSPADMKLINLIAQQAGVAAYTVRLNNDLQKSRERLVTAQEEERRRLRRDLHDGVGPTLASFSQRLETATDLVNTNPQASIELLKDLKGQVKHTVADIRRLVYALRPPVLDEFGLVTAIREHVAPYTGPNGLQITFDITEPMPTLSAAVEVAVYRIALEAFTNLVNHAQANTCHISLRIEDNSLLLQISDNGKGFSSSNHAGIGLTSMRQRAAELGGECVVETNLSGGTSVRAKLPISDRNATFRSPP